MDHVKITFDPDVLDYIVSLAIDFKLGARGLRSICESIMIDVMFENPTAKQPNIRITKIMAMIFVMRIFGCLAVGFSNITSIIMDSQIDRNPLAPSLKSMASETM